MIKHTVTFCKVFMEFLTSIFKDMCSFRNKITVFVCVFLTLCIWFNRHDTTIVLASLGFLDTYLIYYLHNRKKNEPK